MSCGPPRPEPVNPESLGFPRGYSNGMLAPAGARLLFVAGQVGWDGDQHIVSDEFTVQFEQALANALTVVEAAGGGATSIVRLTVYVTDKSEYLSDLPGVGRAYRRVLGRHFPAMSLVEVAGLVEDGAKVEVEATAAV